MTTPSVCAIAWYGTLDEPGVGRLMAAVHRRLRRAPEVSVLHLYLHSYGGSAAHGFALYSMLRALDGVRVVTWNVGSVASAATPVFLAGAERYAVPGSVFTFHGACLNLGFLLEDRPSLVNGLLWERDLRSELAGLATINAQMATIYRERCPDLTEQETAALLGSPEHRTPEWALERGVVHGIRHARIPPGAWLETIDSRPAPSAALTNAEVAT